MTTFTLTTVAVLLLGSVLSGVGIVLACLLVWTARRMGDVSQVRGELSTLSTQFRNLDEIFESFRTRDAQRASTASKRAAKEAQADPPAQIPITNRDDIVRLFESQRKGNGVQ